MQPKTSIVSVNQAEQLEPQSEELTPLAIASGLRALSTLLGGILGTLGVVSPEVYQNAVGKYFALALALALVIVPRIWSWMTAKGLLRKANTEIAEGLHLSPRKTNGAPLLIAEVKQIAAAKQARALAAEESVPAVATLRRMDELEKTVEFLRQQLQQQTARAAQPGPPLA
jgi:hypothetical protein